MAKVGIRPKPITELEIKSFIECISHDDEPVTLLFHLSEASVVDNLLETLIGKIQNLRLASLKILMYTNDLDIANLPEGLARCYHDPKTSVYKIVDETSNLLEDNTFTVMAKQIYEFHGTNQLENILFHAGHRIEWDANLRVPDAWLRSSSKEDLLEDLQTEIAPPTILDFRVKYNHDSNGRYFPTSQEQLEIELGVKLVKKLLQKVKEIKFCGFTPVSFGVLIGKYWARGTHTKLYTWNHPDQNEWSINFKQLDLNQVRDLNFVETL
jgi:hypothetical protein